MLGIDARLSTIRRAYGSRTWRFAPIRESVGRRIAQVRYSPIADARASPIESEASANITDRSIAGGNASALRARTLPGFSCDVQAEGFGFSQREAFRSGQRLHRFERVRARVERKRALIFRCPQCRPHDIRLAASTRDWSGPLRHDRLCMPFSTLLGQRPHWASIGQTGKITDGPTLSIAVSGLATAATAHVRMRSFTQRRFPV
jgi:hypothetical protein